MKNYLVYTTVTTWNEPPRARHQVSNELKAEGIVFFVERNQVGSPRIEVNKVEENVYVLTPYFPVLCKIRYRTPLLNELYHNWLLKEIKSMQVPFEMVISFDYTAPAINKHFDNVVFYCADDNVGFGNFNPFFINKYHSFTERLVAKNARACIVTSDYMRTKIGAYNSNTHVVPLGAPLIEYDTEISVQKDKKLPTLGLVGYLDSNMDMILLHKLLDKFPLVFIGPISQANKEILAKYPNAKFVGPKTGQDLYDTLAETDVCIAPYDVKKLNKGATPNKLWLYLALGKPAVVIDMPNIKNWHFENDLVYKCNKDQFIDCCVTAYENNTPELAKRRMEIAKSNSWKNRIAQVKEIYYSVNPTPAQASNFNISV